MQSIINDIAEQMAQSPDKGAVASYIPQLAKIDPNQFAISVALPNGEIYAENLLAIHLILLCS